MHAEALAHWGAVVPKEKNMYNVTYLVNTSKEIGAAELKYKDK